jgi:hypothetical protein
VRALAGLLLGPALGSRRTVLSSGCFMDVVGAGAFPSLDSMSAEERRFVLAEIVSVLRAVSGNLDWCGDLTLKDKEVKNIEFGRFGLVWIELLCEEVSGVIIEMLKFSLGPSDLLFASDLEVPKCSGTLNPFIPLSKSSTRLCTELCLPFLFLLFVVIVSVLGRK